MLVSNVMASTTVNIDTTRTNRRLVRRVSFRFSKNMVLRYDWLFYLLVHIFCLFCHNTTGNQGVLNLNSQHMVVILIVFCALVFGMCASITISCWSKIEERKERKREYKLRSSRETSMEGGLNRTMTITSLDRSTTGYIPEQHTSIEQASSSSGSRSHRKITTANAIRHKDMIEDDNMDVV